MCFSVRASQKNFQIPLAVSHMSATLFIMTHLLLSTTGGGQSKYSHKGLCCFLPATSAILENLLCVSSTSSSLGFCGSRHLYVALLPPSGTLPVIFILHPVIRPETLNKSNRTRPTIATTVHMEGENSQISLFVLPCSFFVLFQLMKLFFHF